MKLQKCILYSIYAAIIINFTHFFHPLVIYDMLVLYSCQQIQYHLADDIWPSSNCSELHRQTAIHKFSLQGLFGVNICLDTSRLLGCGRKPERPRKHREDMNYITRALLNYMVMLLGSKALVNFTSSHQHTLLRPTDVIQTISMGSQLTDLKVMLYNPMKGITGEIRKQYRIMAA